MEIQNGSTCHLSRKVGSKTCVKCIFNNDSYCPREGYQFCVFPEEGKWMKEKNSGSI